MGNCVGWIKKTGKILKKKKKGERKGKKGKKRKAAGTDNQAKILSQ